MRLAIGFNMRVSVRAVQICIDRSNKLYVSVCRLPQRADRIIFEKALWTISRYEVFTPILVWPIGLYYKTYAYFLLQKSYNES